MAEKSILVIDNETEIIQSIMSSLESEGYLVFTSSDVDVSIKMADKIRPSLIFINIGIGGVSGLEACKKIHDSDILKSVPIIVITPHGGTIDSRLTSTYGIVDFLKKPFSNEELISKTIGAFAKGTVLQPVEEEIGGQISETEHLGAEPIRDELEVQPAEEQVAAQPLKERFDLQSFKEEKPVSKPVEEKIKIKPVEMKQFKEKLTEERIGIKSSKGELPIKAVENEIETQLLEEQVEIEKTKPTKVAPQEIQKRITKEIVSEKPKIKKEVTKGMGKEIFEHYIPEKQEEEETSSPTPLPQKKDSLYRATGRGKGGTNKRLMILILILLLITIAAGVVAYMYIGEKIKIQIPFISKPSKPVEQQPVQQQVVVPPQEIQKPQKVEEIKPVTPLPAVEKKPKPEIESKTKPVYSVQVGAFKNEINAAILIKQYKEKGYNAFIHKSTERDKGTLYRVLIGSFNDRREAVNLANSIRKKEKISVTIFHE
ncbi:MAG: response regulator [Nitrospirota bacterium]